MIPWSLIYKALQHKYVRRWRDAKGRYRYEYPRDKGDRHSKEAHISRDAHLGEDDHYQAGSAFSAGAGKGHYIIESVKDGKVTFHHDDTDGKGTKGNSETLSLSEFKARIQEAHKEAFERAATEGLQKRKDILQRAKMHGTEDHIKRAEKELARWKEKHGDLLPKEVLPNAEPPKQAVPIFRREGARWGRPEKESTSSPATEPSQEKVTGAQQEAVQVSMAHGASLVQTPEKVAELEAGGGVSSIPAPNVWDLPPSRLSDLRRKGIISQWEEDFTKGKQHKAIASFSEKQQKVLMALQEKFEAAWDRDTLGDKQTILAESRPVEVVKNKNSLPFPDLSTLKRGGVDDLLSLGLISAWENGFLYENVGRKNLSAKQQAIVDRIQKSAKEEWGKLTQEQQSGFLEKHAPPSMSSMMPVSGTPKGMEKFTARGLSLHNYQQEYVSWALNTTHGINAMETGLGKTVSTIAAFHHLKEGGVVERMVVAAPNSAINSWRKEFANSSDARVLFFEGGPKKRAELLKSWERGEYDVMVMTHGIALKDKEAIAPHVDTKTQLVLDEAHRFKNPDAKRTQAMQGLAGYAGRVMALTATPQPNSPVELYTLSQLAQPGLLGYSKWDFAERYCHILRSKHGSDIGGYRRDAQGQLREDLAPLMFIKRRNDPDVNIALPERHQVSVDIGMDDATKKAYNAVIEDAIQAEQHVEELYDKLKYVKDQLYFLSRSKPYTGSDIADIEMYADDIKAHNARMAKMKAKVEAAQNAYDEARESKKTGSSNALTKLLRLRQISISPSLVDDGHKEESQKIEHMAETVFGHFDQQRDRGAVIFSEFNKGLDEMKASLLKRGMDESHIAVITGATSAAQRAKIENDLNTGKIKVLLANTKAMQEGANLQGNANFVGVLDTPWNPAALTQAIDRVHRQGQKNPVTVYHPVSSPIEEYQRSVLLSKLEQSEIAMGGKGGSEEALIQSLKIPTTPEGMIQFFKELRA